MHTITASTATGLGASALMISTLACVPGCSGGITGDQRPAWLPATTLSGPGPSVNVAYAGSEGDLPFGFTASGYFSLPTDIPHARSMKEARVTSLIFQSLGRTVLDFGHPAVRKMIADDAVLYMTNMDAWPNGFFSQDFGKAYRLQILNAEHDKISDCGGGDCSISDVIVLKNHGFDPSSDELDALTPAEAAQLAELVEVASEEEASNYWMDALAETQRNDYIAKVEALWDAASSSREEDAFLSDAWMTSGLAYAIDDAGLSNYALRPALTHTIEALFPASSAAERAAMEAALVSALQLLGAHASALIGLPGRCYHDYYRACDERAGRSVGSYDHYRTEFIRRESFSHLVRRGDARTAYPAFLRPFYAGAFLSAHLDRQFSDGIAHAAIRKNAYLGDFDALLALVANVIPALIAQENTP